MTYGPLNECRRGWQMLFGYFGWVYFVVVDVNVDVEERKTVYHEFEPAPFGRGGLTRVRRVWLDSERTGGW